MIRLSVTKLNSENKSETKTHNSEFVSVEESIVIDITQFPHFSQHFNWKFGIEQNLQQQKIGDINLVVFVSDFKNQFLNHI